MVTSNSGNKLNIVYIYRKIFFSEEIKKSYIGNVVVTLLLLLHMLKMPINNGFFR